MVVFVVTVTQPDADVVVVGAGMSGLTAAVLLNRSGWTVRVVEAGDAVGGRVRTDRIDGFVLDRGFQVLLPAYPQVRAMIDLAALRPRALPRGVAAHTNQGRQLLAWPLARGVDAGRAAGAVGRFAVWAPRDAAAIAAFSARDVLVPRRVLAGPDRSIAEDLAGWRISSAVVRQVLRPFLAGVLLDPDLGVSARQLHLVWRCFLLGGAVLPAAGMQAVPEQLAAALPAGSITCSRPVTALLNGAEAGGARGVRLADGSRLTGRTVLIATDGTDAAGLTEGVTEPRWQSDLTVYYRLPAPAHPSPVLAVDAGLTPEATAQGPLNTLVSSAVAPEYAPRGQALVAATLPGRAQIDGADERRLRRRLAALYDTDTGDWEELATYRIPRALPFAAPGAPMRRPVRLAPGLFICGDHRDTSSMQGAMVSGRRAARAIHDELSR